MQRHIKVFSTSIVLALASCSMPDKSNQEQNEQTPIVKLSQLQQPAPIAEKTQYSFSHHGYTVSDPWNWLRDTSYPNTDDEDVLDYLNKENEYFQAWLNPQKTLAEKLFEEFKGRYDDTETSVPWVDNGYEYRWEYREGAEYRTYFRKPLNTEDAKEEVFLDQPALAEGKDYFVLRDYSISRDNKLLAYAIDTDGDERYDITIVDLSTGKPLADTIKDAAGSVEFADDNSLIYTKLEANKWRTKSVNRHILGTNSATDKILITEPDDQFFLSFYFSSDRQYLMFSSGNGNVSEIYALPNKELGSEPTLLASREQGFIYGADHAHGKFYILANDTHVNFRMASVDSLEPAYENWQTLLAGSDNVYLQQLETFNDFIAIEKSTDGLEKIALMTYDGKQTDISFPESVAAVGFFNNPEFAQSHIRLNYESMITPDTIFDYQVENKKLVERKVKTIPSGYDKSKYETKRIMITARDGVKVPVTLMYLKGTKLDGTNPLHLYGYGAYGSGLSPSFSTTRLSFVDRGVVFALAHVRGGDEMGFQWYLDGKLEKRENTFNDFVDVARELVELGYTKAGNISISGRSAGGELVGAATIQAPEMWASVVLGVPFVDVLNTMLDASLPLTPPEWKEWGNPIEDKAAFELIRDYCPYTNIEKRDYPPMLVTGGLNDPRVTYWEPAKWTAKMRDYKTDENLLIMRMNMGAGHFANSGRFGRLMDYAEEVTFTLMSHGISE